MWLVLWFLEMGMGVVAICHGGLLYVARGLRCFVEGIDGDGYVWTGCYTSVTSGNWVEESVECIAKAQRIVAKHILTCFTATR